MLTVYKKVEKTMENTGGIIEISNPDELSRPFLFCISAQDNYDKSIYGIIREGAQAARVYTTQEMAAGFRIDDMPIDFLGFRFVRDDMYGNNYEEIVDKFLFPYLIGAGNRSFDEIKRQVRKMNFMTYCNGTITYEKIEARLEQKLKSMGYTVDEIDSILSQVSLTAIGTDVDIGEIKATTVAFIDVNDDEILTSATSSYVGILKEKGCKSFYGRRGRNILYIYDGSGIHSLKEYFADNRVVKPAICGVVAYLLENSIAENLVQISRQTVVKQLQKYADETKVPSVLLEILDNGLSYNNSRRYTVGEMEIMNKLEEAYKRIRAITRRMEQKVADNSRLAKDKDLLVKGIGEYSSETTFYQIMTFAGLWNMSSDSDILEEPSDKTIRQEYEALVLGETINQDDSTQIKK